MKRQILIRGAAIAFAGVAASVFAAQQFMGLNPQTAQVTTPGASDQVRAASLVGTGSQAAQSMQTEFAVQEDTLELTAPAYPEVAMDMSDNVVTDQDVFAALDTTMTPARDAAMTDDFQPALTLAQAAPQVQDGSCQPSLTAVPAIDALVDMRLTAPCAPNARVVISHGDLAFSAFTDETGSFAAYVPALSVNAEIEAFLPDQSVLQAQAIVPDADQHVRVVVQWTGNDGVMLHAYHRNAAFGDAGHIHASRPFDPEMDAAFVLSLGEARGPEPMLSQVYSIPATLIDQTRLELEVAVTAQTCGRDMTAYVAKSGTGQSGLLEELTLAMPECGGAGGMAIVPLPMGGASMQANAEPAPALALTQN